MNKRFLLKVLTTAFLGISFSFGAGLSTSGHVKELITSSSSELDEEKATFTSPGICCTEPLANIDENYAIRRPDVPEALEIKGIFFYTREETDMGRSGNHYTYIFPNDKDIILRTRNYTTAWGDTSTPTVRGDIYVDPSGDYLGFTNRSQNNVTSYTGYRFYASEGHAILQYGGYWVKFRMPFNDKRTEVLVETSNNNGDTKLWITHVRGTNNFTIHHYGLGGITTNNSSKVYFTLMRGNTIY